MSKRTPESSTILSLEQIRAIDDRAPIVVQVPEWGGTVRVRALTLQQIANCAKRAANEKRGGEVNPEVRNGWYLVEGMVEPQITLGDAEAWLTERAAGPSTRILATILDASGLTERAVESAKSGDSD